MQIPAFIFRVNTQIKPRDDCLKVKGTQVQRLESAVFDLQLQQAMPSQLSQLMIHAGANLINYPDLVLALEGHGIEKKKKLHSQNSLRSFRKCQLRSAKLSLHFSP